MLVFWKKRLVLFSIPKTATSAISTALGPNADVAFLCPPSIKHVTVYRYNRYLKPFFCPDASSPTLETMAIIREPLDWLGSWYRYLSRDEIVGKSRSTKGVSFDQFVNGALRAKPASFANVGSQARFLSGGVGAGGWIICFNTNKLGWLLIF